jgi:hypothetical protein
MTLRPRKMPGTWDSARIVCGRLPRSRPIRFLTSSAAFNRAQRDWPFLAMVHDRLAHRDEARRWLDRLGSRQPSTNPNKSWEDLQISLFRGGFVRFSLRPPMAICQFSALIASIYGLP